MNKTSDQNTASPGDQTQPAKNAPGSTQRPQDPRETAPNIGKKPGSGKPFQPGPARGNDEVMGEQPGKQT